MLDVALITYLIPYHGIYFALPDMDAPIRPTLKTLRPLKYKNEDVN